MTLPISFGSDPEFMLVDKKGNLQSAVEIIQGNSDNRIHIQGHSFYHDNVLAECAIRPAQKKEAVIESFRECFKLFAEMSKPYKLITRASAIYPDDQLQTPDAKEAGCNRESCAYTQDFLPKRSQEIETSPFRSGGGHVHVGVNSPVWLNKDTGHYGPKMFDVFLGLPSVFLDQDPTSKARRSLYGGAGSFRKTKYGCEYRTLSNFWLASPKLVGLIYDLTEFVANFVAEERHLDLWSEDKAAIENYEAVEDCYFCHGYDVERLKIAINTGDKRRARPFMTGLVAKYLPSQLMDDISQASEPAKYDMYKEWSL